MATVELLPEVTAFLARQQGHFIHGRAIPGSTHDRAEIRNPANGELITTVARATEDEVEEAIASSYAAFKGSWAQTAPTERERILMRFADLIEEHSEQIAQLETLQSRKLLALSRMIEVGWATKISGETLSPSIPSIKGEQYTAMTLRAPIGVVFGIIPWNFPVMIPIWKLGAALATGNTALLKSASLTPLSLLRVAELGKEAGLPDGALNVINGPGRIGDQIIPDERIAKVTLTGSVCTGNIIAEKAMKANLKRVTLELGGKNAAGFLPDMSIEEIVDGIFEAGTVWVNMHTIVDPSVPFGGAKGSGIGREYGSAFIVDYTELKSVMIRY